jgi:hypothetical protein
MRKITLVLSLMIFAFGFTQSTLEDFDGNYAQYDGVPNWGTANGLGGVSVTADPLDANNQVAEIISSAAGDAWQQADLLLQTNRADLSSDNTISVDVYATQDFNMMLKVEDVDGAGATTSGAQQSYVSGNGWQTLVFTYDSSIDNLGIANGEYRKVSFFPNWAGNQSGTNGVNADWNTPTDFTIYVDNINATAGSAIISCSDGLQNGDETGVDCGGSCAPCEAAETEILEDFDGATAPTIGLANNDGGAATAEIVPDPTGVNGNTLRFITDAAGVAWQQAELTLQDKYVDLTPTVTNTMSIDVYSTEPIDVMIRVTGGIDTTTGVAVADSAADGIHGGTGWETVEFDFSSGQTQDNQPTPAGAYNKIYLFNLWDANDSGSGAGAWTCSDGGSCAEKTLYYDNIRGVLGVPPVVDFTPNSGPTAPIARNAWDVISMYGGSDNSYTDEDNVEFNPFGDYATIEGEITTQDGNSLIRRASNHAIHGIGNETQGFDVSEMTMFHIDFYTSSDLTPSPFKIKFEGLDGSNQEIEVPGGGALLADQWHSIDIDLSTYPNVNFSQLKWIVPVTWGGPRTNIYYDNVYFYREATASISDLSALKFNVSPNPSNTNWNISGNTEINKVSLFDILGKEVMTITPNSTRASIDASSFGTGIYFARIQAIEGTRTVKLIKR